MDLDIRSAAWIKARPVHKRRSVVAITLIECESIY